MTEIIVYGLGILIVIAQIYIFARAVFDKDVNKRRPPRL